MKRMERKWGIGLLILLLALCLPVSALAKASLSKEKMTIYVGQKKTLTAKGFSGTITFTSSDKKVAKVSKKGKVTAIAPGTAIITAASGKKTATCGVTVKKIQLHRTKRTAYVGSEFKLKLKCGSTNGITFTSSNDRVVSFVRQEGNLGYFVGKKAGKATVKATYKGKTYKCKVTIKEMGGNLSPTPTPVYIQDGDWEPDVQMPITK